MKIPLPTHNKYEDEHSENIFLDTLIGKNQQIDVFLLGGVKLTGHIIGHDDFSLVILKDRKEEQLIYKHSILSIQISHKEETNFYKKIPYAH